MFIENIDAEQKIIEWLRISGLPIEDLDKITGGNYIIFGGACRDAFAGEDKCSDIDILTYQTYIFPGSIGIKVYDSNDYLNGIHGRRIRFKNNIDIDLLTPDKECITFKDFIDVLAGTDMNISGIGYCSRMGFIETEPDQIKFAKRKCFTIKRSAKGYHEQRTNERALKLIKNDWLEIK